MPELCQTPRETPVKHCHCGDAQTHIVGCSAALLTAWGRADCARQRFQQLFFPDGISFDGNRFIGTGATAPAFITCGRLRLEMKIWWTRPGSNR